MKYIDADRLKEEFQKRFDICKRVSEDDRNALDTQDWYRGKYTAYSECLSFIDSLQQEQTEVDFEQELYKHFGQVKDFTLGMRIGKYFYELGKNSK